MGGDFLLDDRLRGFPSGHVPVRAADLAGLGWFPADGRMALPLISLDREAFAGNAALMLGHVTGKGALIAPHAKTPMVPELAAALVAAGAWGTTVADIRQAGILLRAGQRRLILANEVGGAAAARRLAALIAGYPDAELHVFVDSPEVVAGLAAAWAERDDLPPLGLLIELGIGRAGARDLATAETVLAAALAAETSHLRITGLASYEGAAGTPDPVQTEDRIRRLVAMMADFLPRLRRAVGPERELTVTAGGSLFFDWVLDGLLPAIAADGNSRLILRSGAIFFHDHGVYKRGLAALDARSGFARGGSGPTASDGFRPVLRLWAEVLSRPEPDLVIAGMGMRDVALDQGLPLVLNRYRAGARFDLGSPAEVTRLNDQHAFIKVTPEADLAVGDVLEFGISHPCTCLDRHGVIYGLDAAGKVTHAWQTRFG